MPHYMRYYADAVAFAATMSILANGYQPLAAMLLFHFAFIVATIAAADALFRRFHIFAMPLLIFRDTTFSLPAILRLSD